MRLDWGVESFAQKIGRWLLWWLFVRMILESGIVKLTWGDEKWLGYSALDYHFETQPLPLWTSWYAHQLPRWLLRAECWLTYFVEIATPILLLAPTRWRFLRHGTVLLHVLLQLGIMATGNYTYFNWLTIALCVPFLDDAFRGFRKLRLPDVADKPRPWWPLIPVGALGLASVCLTFDGFSGAFAGLAGQEAEIRRMREEFQRTMKAPVQPWHAMLRSFNGYGLFRTMTLSRPEFILEGSDDGVNWHEYEFPHKAGDIYRRPSLVAPFQPRLDWQMWFAALSPQHYGYLLERLMKRVLEGEPSVLALLEKNPFASHPPRLVRLSLYDYHFTRFADGGAAWWKRDPKGATKPLSLEDVRRRTDAREP